MPENYSVEVPERDAIDALPGLVLLDFGVDWCPHCQRASGLVAAALEVFPGIVRIGVEDGPGRRLGRSFRVKLWPSLILLREGRELGRLVRPTGVEEVRDWLALLAD